MLWWPTPILTQIKTTLAWLQGVPVHTGPYCCAQTLQTLAFFKTNISISSFWLRNPWMLLSISKQYVIFVSCFILISQLTKEKKSKNRVNALQKQVNRSFFSCYLNRCYIMSICLPLPLFKGLKFKMIDFPVYIMETPRLSFIWTIHEMEPTEFFF